MQTQLKNECSVPQSGHNSGFWICYYATSVICQLDLETHESTDILRRSICLIISLNEHTNVSPCQAFERLEKWYRFTPSLGSLILYLHDLAKIDTQICCQTGNKKNLLLSTIDFRNVIIQPSLL